MPFKTGTSSYIYGNTTHPHQITGVSNTDGSDTLHYYYVSGTDGLAGLHIVKTSPNAQTTTSTTKVITDHLGSLMSMADNSDWCFDAHYDPWGHREVSYPYLYSIERGFTGHEQLDGLRLIDMGGRMYDPQLARFLSPDNFVQAPTAPQNYNRYSYCLNNPLKYTDPSGEIVWTPIIIAAVMGGVQGTMFGLQNGAEGWDMVGYIAGGAALGALSGGMAQGMAAIGATPFVSQLTCNAVTSSLGAGMMSGWNGKSMLMGLGSGLLSGCAFGAISLSSFNYDPVGLINGMLADGVINAATGAFTSGIITAFYGGSIKDVGDAVLNGAIMGAISGVASGAYRGWTNAETLGVNHWTGGTLQERAQAWVDYYGFKDVEVYVLNKENIAKYNNYHGKYRLEKDYLSNKINAYKNGVIKPSPIDGITRIQYHQIYFTKASVRHASFSSSWGAGTFWHEYYHVLTQDINEFIPYQKGLQYGGISYYCHCMDYPDFAQYGFVKPHR